MGRSDSVSLWYVALLINTRFRVFISSVECKKVVSDILGEIEFLTDIKSAGKMTHF